MSHNISCARYGVRCATMISLENDVGGQYSAHTPSFSRVQTCQVYLAWSKLLRKQVFASNQSLPNITVFI